MRRCASPCSLACLVGVLGLLLASVATRAHAQVAVGEHELRARLVALERVEQLDASVRRPLELAESALGRAKQRAAAGDEEGASRARRIAGVALELAEARLRLLRERALESGSAARRRTAEVDSERARAALARERERALSLAREDAAASAAP